MDTEKELATHRHYKGGLYRVLYTDIHDANNGNDYERLTVIYQPLGGDLAMRYHDEFFGYVEVDGQRIRRFAPLSDLLEST